MSKRIEFVKPEANSVNSVLSQGYLHLGDLHNDMDRKDEALNYLKKAEAMFTEMEMDYYIKKTQEVLERL